MTVLLVCSAVMILAALAVFLSNDPLSGLAKSGPDSWGKPDKVIARGGGFPP